MSLDKEPYEAKRRFDTALEDLDAAQALMDKGSIRTLVFLHSNPLRRLSRRFGFTGVKIPGDARSKS
jgi:hypothetical protein